MLNVGILGLGHLGGAIARGLRASKTFAVQGTVRAPLRAQAITKDLGIPCHTDNLKLLADCNVIVFAPKPRDAKAALEPLVKALTPGHLVISLCAGVSTSLLKEWSGGKASLIRAMPNTPCLIGFGVTSLYGMPNVKAVWMQQAREIFAAVGETVVVTEERLMDPAAVVGASSPAFMYMIANAMMQAGKLEGLSPEVARTLAAHSMIGAGQMLLHTTADAAELMRQVATPGGCTEQGIFELQKRAVPEAVQQAVIQATAHLKKML